MDQAEPSPFPGQPERPRQRAYGSEPVPRSGRDAALDHAVVAGYDGSPSSRNALAYAAGVSWRLARPLVVVYVIPGVYCEPLTGQVIGAPRARAETERWIRGELEDVCGCGGMEARVVMRHGNPARELAAAADELSADALVIGAPRQRWHQLCGSVPGWLARHAHCPVIVVP
jgi:nucleotide-binding universal stress UspA family protein